jgi:hypothetical protein
MLILDLSAVPILMDTVRVPVAGAFMPTMPPKAIGGTMRAYSTRF